MTEMFGILKYGKAVKNTLKTVAFDLPDKITTNKNNYMMFSLCTVCGAIKMTLQAETMQRDHNNQIGKLIIAV